MSPEVITLLLLNKTHKTSDILLTTLQRQILKAVVDIYKGN